MSDDDPADISTRLAERAAEPEEVQRLIEQSLVPVERRAQEQEDQLEKLEQLIFLEQERVVIADNLRQTLEAAQERLAEQRHRIAVRQQALELLAGAGRHLSRRFNRDLRDLVGRLPEAEARWFRDRLSPRPGSPSSAPGRRSARCNG